jgi:hypothetical protein
VRFHGCRGLQSAGTESARIVELEHGRTLVDAMRVQLDGLRESQTAAESESGDLRVEAAEHDLKLQVCARWSVCLADSTARHHLR